MVENLEQAVSDPQAEQLAEKARAEPGFIRKTAGAAAKLGMAAGSTVLAYSTGGTAPLVIGGALGTGTLLGKLYKNKPIAESVNDAVGAYTAINTILYPLDLLGNAIFTKIPNTAVGVASKLGIALGPYLATFIGAFNGANHLYNKYLNPKGMWKSIKHNFGNTWKRLAGVFAPGLGLYATGYGMLNLPKALPLIGKTLPAFAPNALFSGFYNEVKPIPEKTSEKQPTQTPEFGPEQQYSPEQLQQLQQLQQQYQPQQRYQPQLAGT